ncbi:MAG: RNA methyltransferase [Acidobacteria bacterium]|nr:RNA methyltransferase [Acidobacteriota bacterium]
MESARDVIRSRTNPLVRRLRTLKERGDSELALLEGVKLVEEAAEAGATLVEVAASPRALEAPRGRSVIEALRARGVAVRVLAEDVLASLSELETSQGILALAHRPTPDEEDLYRGTPLLLVAVGIQNPGNLGGLLRSAEAAGATGAYLTRGCADPFSWKALRGSMGSAFRLPIVTGLEAREVVTRLRSRGVTLAATASAGGAPPEKADLRGPVAVLLGSEGSGLPEEIARVAGIRISIPMGGQVESLNVGVAAGVLLFEAARQRRSSPGGEPVRSDT